MTFRKNIVQYSESTTKKKVWFMNIQPNYDLYKNSPTTAEYIEGSAAQLLAKCKIREGPLPRPFDNLTISIYYITDHRPVTSP